MCSQKCARPEMFSGSDSEPENAGETNTQASEFTTGQSDRCKIYRLTVEKAKTQEEDGRY